MTNGLYIAASGMMANVFRQNVIANNLANVNTAGFKRSQQLDVAFPVSFYSRLHDQRLISLDGTMEVRPPIGFVGGGVLPQETTLDFTQGSRFQTGNPLDFALTGPGYFTVQGPDGSLLYTRNGSFSLDGEGRLVTKDGFPVLGHNGEIFLDDGQVLVDAEGNITLDGKEVDSLLIVRFEDERKLERIGHSLFRVAGEVPVDMAPEDLRVQQGFLEQSNVNAVREMVEMMALVRSYEMNARVLSLMDQTLGLAANDVGTIRG